MCKRWSVALATLCYISAIAVVPHISGSVERQPTPKEKSPLVDQLGDPLPEHALLRIGTNRLRLNSVVTNMTFTADGKRLVTINRTSGGQVCEANTGKELCKFGRPLRYEGGTDLPIGAVSPDGSLAVCLDDDGKMRVYDTSTGKAKHELRPPQAAIAQICISPDNKLLAYGDVKRIMYVWDLSIEQGPLWSSDLVKDQLAMPRLAFGPDSKTLAMLYKTTFVQFLDARTGELERSLDIKTVSDSQWLMFAPDGKTFVTRTGYNTGTLEVRDSTTGEPLQHLYHLPAVGRCDLASAVYSPDGKAIAVANASPSYVQILVWDIATGKQLRSLPCPAKGPKSMAVSPDGKFLAGGDREGFIGLWDTKSGEPVLGFEGHRVPNIEVRFTTDSKRLISMSMNKTTDDRWSDESRKPRYWDAATGKLLPKDTYVVPDLGWFSGNGDEYVFMGTDGNLWFYDVETEKYKWSIEPGEEWKPVLNARFCDGGRILVTAGGRSYAALEMRLFPQLGREVPESAITVGIWDATSGNRVRTIKTDREFCHVDERNVYLQVSKAGEFVYWDFRSGYKTSRRLQNWNNPDLALNNTAAMVVSPNGHFMFPQAKNRDSASVQVWDIPTGQPLTRLRAENERLTRMAFSPDSAIIAAGTVSGNIYLWSLGSPNPIAKLVGHRGSIFSLDFSPDGKRLVSGSDDTTILVWDVDAWTDHTKKKPAPLDKEATEHWKALAETDAPHQIIERFLQSPKESVKFLRGKLHPPKMDDIRKHIAALDGSKFAERELAMAALRKLGMDAKPALYSVLQGKPTLELRRRVELLLTKLENEPLPAESLQTLRGLDILEMLATPDAIALLESLSKGDPDTWLTQEAAWALKRARKRLS